MLPSTTFETLRTYHGTRVFAFDEHLERLWKSTQILSIPLPASKDAIKQVVAERIEQESKLHPNRNFRIRIIWDGKNFEVQITILEEMPEEWYRKGVKIEGMDFERPTSRAKYETEIYKKVVEKQKPEIFETIFFDSNGFLREGNYSNVFAVLGKTIVTPEKNILLGITRDIIIGIIKKDQELKLEVREISKDELMKTDEIFLTNTTKGIVPVRQWNGWKNGKFTITEKLRQEFNQKTTA